MELVGAAAVWASGAIIETVNLIFRSCSGSTFEADEIIYLFEARLWLNWRHTHTQCKAM